jgi:hypothetical protein
LVTVLFTFYIQGEIKLKKNNSGAKRLRKYEARSVVASLAFDKQKMGALVNKGVIFLDL